MGSFFVMQGALMNREVGGSGFTVPAASLALFNTLGIILLIPLYDRLVVLLRRYGKKISLLQRIGELLPSLCVKSPAEMDRTTAFFPQIPHTPVIPPPAAHRWDCRLPF